MPSAICFNLDQSKILSSGIPNWGHYPITYLLPLSVASGQSSEDMTMLSGLHNLHLNPENSRFRLFCITGVHHRPVVILFGVLRHINSILVIQWQQFTNPCFLDYF